MKCRVCSKENLVPILDLGNQPWCNDFRLPESPPAETYPLKLVYCPDCGLAQLDYTIKKEIMFTDHTYVSGTTQTLADHFYNLAIENNLQFNLNPYKDLVVDIGGNDGTQLLQYLRAGFPTVNLINVESALNIAKISDQNGIPTSARFFNEDWVNDFLSGNCYMNSNVKFSPKKAKIINASGVFFHLEELHSVCRGVKNLLDDEGVFVVQFMYLKDIIEHCAFDAIYHEHLCYYTLKSLMNLMEMHDMVMIDAYEHPIHGGSMMAKFVHSTSRKPRSWRGQQALEREGHVGLIELENFAIKVKEKKEMISNHLTKLKSEGKTIYGYGSPAKGTTLLNYCQIGPDVLNKLVEINPLKVGRISPGTNIPIKLELKDDYPDYYFCLAWNFIDEIIGKNQDILDKGCKFISPLPEWIVYQRNL